MARGPTTFKLGSEVEPAGDPTWNAAAADLRLKFWRAVVLFTKDAKDDELAAGLDRFGQKLRPIARVTRDNRRSAMGPADPSAPPLMPAYAVSRTRLWFTGRASSDGATFGWKNGWGRILAMHAAGIGKRRKVKRDVIGLSPASVAKVRKLAQAWWRRETARGVATVRLPQPLAAPQAQPLRATGSTNYSAYTFGIGGAGPPGPGTQATGFSARGPGQGLPAFGGPGTIPARPKPPPMAPAPELGPMWTTVLVNVQSVERDLADPPGPGPRRFNGAVEQPRLALDFAGQPILSGGRRVWAWARDNGVAAVPVSVRRAQAAEVRRRYGA